MKRKKNKRSVKKRKIGASGDYAKYEISVIKALAKLLKQPYNKVQVKVNENESLLNIISKGFDNKQTVSQTAKELKEKLTETVKKHPASALLELLTKMPKATGDKLHNPKFPMKLPATVTIGNVTSINGTDMFNELYNWESAKKHIHNEIKKLKQSAKAKGDTFFKKIKLKAIKLLQHKLKVIDRRINEQKRLIKTSLK
jgi:Txe/YoeB family toxin of Txe-Axe toxin-antitoxin module